MKHKNDFKTKLLVKSIGELREREMTQASEVLVGCIKHRNMLASSLEMAEPGMFPLAFIRNPENILI